MHAMSVRRLLAAAILAAVTSLPLAAAAQTRTETTRFLVSVRGTLTKQWSYTRSKIETDCATTIKGSGLRTITLRSSDVSVVAGSWAGGKARARFGGSIRLAGTIKQSGTQTITTRGMAGCDKGTRRVTCGRLMRSFRAKTARLVSRRVHRLGLRRIAGLVPADVYTSCPGEPTAVRALASGIELAGATYSERELFDRTTAGMTLQGSADITTKLLSSPANVVQHVRWTLILRRVGA